MILQELANDVAKGATQRETAKAYKLDCACEMSGSDADKDIEMQASNLQQEIVILDNAPGQDGAADPGVDVTDGLVDDDPATMSESDASKSGNQ